MSKETDGDEEAKKAIAAANLGNFGAPTNSQSLLTGSLSSEEDDGIRVSDVTEAFRKLGRLVGLGRRRRP